MTWILPVLLGGGVCYILKWIWDRRSIHSTWKTLGIDGPKASSLLFGNTLEIMNQGRYKILEKWTKKYGKVFGAYEVDLPVLHVADPDLVQEILQKQHHKFENRRTLFDNSENQYVDLTEAVGERWRRVRQAIIPIFTTQTMVDLSPAVDKSVEKLMMRFEDFAKEKQTGFNIHEECRRHTLDAIASAVYGITDSDENVSFYREGIKFLESLAPRLMPMPQKIVILLLLIFPGLLKIARFFSPRIAYFKNDWFLQVAKTKITERQENGEVKNDFIQLVLNLMKETPSAGNGLSMQEAQALVAGFLLGLYEPGTSTLTLAAYYLALYPGVQAKLQKEIDQYFPVAGENIPYDAVEKLSYLDMVFCEVSRLEYVAVFAVQRMCNETTKVGDVTIPKGTKIYINVADLHMNPDLWGPEPTDELVPERFLPERKAQRHPMAYLTFGTGPRYCAGKNFGIMTVKTALVKMLQRYTVIKCDETQIPLKMTYEGVRGPLEGLFLTLKKRQ